MLWHTKQKQWQDQVLIGGESPILVQFHRNPRAKRFILRIDPKTRVPKVTVPGNAHKGQALDFVMKNVAWLTEQLSRAQPNIRFGGQLPGMAKNAP